MNKIAHQPNLYPSEGVTIELQDSVMGNLEIPEEFLTRFKGILAVGSHCAENGVDVKLVHMCATCDSGSGTPKTKIRSFIPRWTLRIRPNDMVPGASPICVFGDNVSKQNIIYHAHQQEKKNKEGQNCRQSRCVGCRYWICETFPDGASWKPGSLAFTVCNALEKLHKGNLSEPIWKDLESELSNTEQPGV
ncbi:hypothetical protein FACS189481_5310 [Clostridia bacterium]|nr:hypothetical protein FACS189481_5310 [Clostridia bacterium]